MKKYLLFLLFGLVRVSGGISEQTLQGLDQAGLRVGDLVFTRTGGPLFTRVGNVSGSWCTHVGVLIGQKDGRWLVAESKVPVVCKTELSVFLGRSEKGAFEIRRLPRPLTTAELERLEAYSQTQLGRLYDTGFDLNSRRTFCSKFAREALHAATGEWVGREESFAELLVTGGKKPLWFWKLWYFGFIPWERKTVTPASLLNSRDLVTILHVDGDIKS